MISKSLLFQRIDSEVSHLGINHCCKEIVNYILSSQEDTAVYAHTDFESAVGDHCSLEIVQLCINFLKSPSVKLLEQKFRYSDADDVIYEVSTEDLQAAFMNGALCLEEMGYPDKDFQRKVYVVFVANKTAVSL